LIDLSFVVWRFVGVERRQSVSRPLFIYGAPRKLHRPFKTIALN
jgi:hypothetical protein